MTHTPLPLTAVKAMLLHAQGLLALPQHSPSKTDVLECIRRIGALQIDTISVVARAPYFILWSRIGNFDPGWLDALLAEGKLFEYWSHAACFLPVEDYPIYRPLMEYMDRRWYNEQWREEHAGTIQQVLERIRGEGAVRSADFERKDGIKGTWWNWKEEKRVLEYLHTQGTLMTARREGFQRVYDLRERVLPTWNEGPRYTLEEARDLLAVRAVRALGLAPARWVYDYFRLPKKDIALRMERLADRGQVQRVAVEGWQEPAYLHPDNRALLERARAGQLVPSLTTLLSPFDPLVADRERGRALFGFDYTIECYTPAPKRRYGYFTLPILHNDQLVGRLDAKAHRKEGIFEVRSLHLEEGVTQQEELAAALAGALRRCARWHNTAQVLIQHSAPERFQMILEAALAQSSP